MIGEFIPFVRVIIGAIIGAVVGFGGTVVADYVDDGQIFNGSFGWEQYLGQY